MQATVAWAGVFIAAVTATGVLLARDWRWQLGADGAAVPGDSDAGIPALAPRHGRRPAGDGLDEHRGDRHDAYDRSNISRTRRAFVAPGPAFRLFMAGMVIVLAAGLASQGPQSAAGVEAPVLAGAILLAGIGALQLGSSSSDKPHHPGVADRPFRL